MKNMKSIRVVPGVAALLLILVLVQGAMAAETYGYVTKWGSYGAGDGQFRNPSGIATDYSGNVCIVDSENNRIEKFTPDGSTLLAKWGSEGSDPGQFKNPSGIAVDSSGNVYVTDLGNDRIEKFTPDGKTVLAIWGSYGSDPGQFEEPVGIAVDSSDNVYVVDPYTYSITKFTSDGTYVTQWGGHGWSWREFASMPTGIAVDSSDNVYAVGDFGIKKFTDDSAFLATWGSEGSADGQFEDPEGIAINPSGNVYVADMGNDRIQEFAKDMTTGSIAVTSTPTGAEIYLDGMDTGKQTNSGPDYTELHGIPSGTHEVKVTLAGYMEQEKQVTVIAGSTVSADFQLVKVPQVGTLKVTSSPSGASIWINGMDTGKTTSFTFEKDSGNYQVVVKLKCYTTPEAQTVAVSPITPAAADFALTSDGSCTSTPEFPSMALPVAMIIGLLGAVLLTQRTREN
jgi:sugar lactone lactonase YvrE